MERLVFCTMPYQQGSYFSGQVNAGFIYTMNAPKEYYETNLLPYLTRIEGLFRMALHGNTYGYASCDTLQVKDYSIYDMAYFNEAEKRRQHGEQFPIDMAECFKMGAELSEH